MPSVEGGGRLPPVGPLRRLGVEMTRDPTMQARVGRLTAVATGMLGVILWVAASEKPPSWVIACLAAGWVLMPVLLAISLRLPAARLLLAVPAAAVLAGLLGVCWSTSGNMVRLAGWVIIACGVALGGSMGLWFWYRLLPVPEGLRVPLAPGRWWLIAVHISLIVAGLALVLIDRAG